MVHPLSEKQFQQRIIDYCAYLKLLTYHVPDSRRSTPGFPDLVICGPGGTIFAELKRDKGRVSLHQLEWQSMLHTSGAETYVWFPQDWPFIEQRLRLLAAPRPGIEPGNPGVGDQDVPSTRDSMS